MWRWRREGRGGGHEKACTIRVGSGQSSLVTHLWGNMQPWQQAQRSSFMLLQQLGHSLTLSPGCNISRRHADVLHNLVLPLRPAHLWPVMVIGLMAGKSQSCTGSHVHWRKALRQMPTQPEAHTLIEADVPDARKQVKGQRPHKCDLGQCHGNCRSARGHQRGRQPHSACTKCLL